MKISFLILLLTGSLNVFAAGDAANGAKLYKKCIMCHGKKGEGKVSQKAPKLAGQYDWYIVSQLKAFKSKKRVNPKMYPFIKNLSDKDYADLGAYISTMK